MTSAVASLDGIANDAFARTAETDDSPLERTVKASHKESLFEKSKKYIDYTIGTIGGLILGSIVTYINIAYGYIPALIAGLKQFTYTLFAGGLMTKFCEYIIVKTKGTKLGRVMAVLIPSIASIAAIYGVHSMKGTPEPLLSTVPGAMLAPLGFTGITYRKMKELKKKHKQYTAPMAPVYGNVDKYLNPYRLAA